MLEVLKRLENQIQEEDSDLLQDEADSDTDDLIDRFAGVDICTWSRFFTWSITHRKLSSVSNI